jgi:hypothetical protein
MIQPHNSLNKIEAANPTEASKVSTIPELGSIEENYLHNQHQDLPELSAIAAPSSGIALACKHSLVGKKLPDAFYIHISALNALEELLQQYESRARSATPQAQSATIVKFSTSKLKISYLFYPDFDTDPHPALQASIQVDLETLEVTHRDYSKSKNPPYPPPQRNFCYTRISALPAICRINQSPRNFRLADKYQNYRHTGWMGRTLKSLQCGNTGTSPHPASIKYHHWCIFSTPNPTSTNNPHPRIFPTSNRPTQSSNCSQ